MKSACILVTPSLMLVGEGESTADDGVEKQFFMSCKLGASKKSGQMFFIFGKNCYFCSLFLKILHSLKRTNPATTAD